MSMYKISGYWKNSADHFVNQVVCNFHDETGEIDVFYRGLSKEQIGVLIDLGNDTDLDFVIQFYKEMDE